MLLSPCALLCFRSLPLNIEMYPFTIRVADKNGLLYASHISTPLAAIARVSAFIKAKVDSPCTFCPRCPERQHPVDVLCYSPGVMDRDALAIMTKLLDRQVISPVFYTFSQVWDVAQYLMLEEAYLATVLMPLLASTRICSDPVTIICIEELYSAGYGDLAKHLYILLCSKAPPETITRAFAENPALFTDTDFFWD